MAARALSWNGAPSAVAYTRTLVSMKLNGRHRRRCPRGAGSSVGPRTQIMPRQVSLFEGAGGLFPVRAIRQRDGNLVFAHGYLGRCGAGNSMVRADHDAGTNLVHAMEPQADSDIASCHAVGVQEKCGPRFAGSRVYVPHWVAFQNTGRKGAA